MRANFRAYSDDALSQAWYAVALARLGCWPQRAESEGGLGVGDFDKWP